MLNEDLINKINNLIKADKLKEALDLLNDNIDQRSDDRTLSNLFGQLTELKRSEINNTVKREDLVVERNKLRKQIIDYLYLLDARNAIIKSMSRWEKIRNTFGPIILISTVISLFIAFFSITNSFIVSCDDFSYVDRKNKAEELERKRAKDNIKLEKNSIQSKSEKQVNGKKNHNETGFETRNITAFDDNGKKVEYIIYLIRGFNWKLGETTISEDFGVEFDICDHLKNIGIVERMNSDNLKAIICFGNTSFEENLNIPLNQRLLMEEDRASKRANKLANCVNIILKRLTPVFTLNLGKHICESETSIWQRQIIIIGLVRKEDGAIEEQALYNGLRLEYLNTNLEFDINDYSKVNNIGKLELSKRYN